MTNKKYWVKSNNTKITYLINANDMDDSIKKMNNIEGIKKFGNCASQMYNNDEGINYGLFNKVNYITG